MSFTIQKPPERTKIDCDPVIANRKAGKKSRTAREKTDQIPNDFVKLAKKFGLPEEHFDFFYEHRKSFHWESKDKSKINCVEKTCKFLTKTSKVCLVDHMSTVHNYKDIKCDKQDCLFIGFSQKNLNYHTATFHGHGKRPDEYGIHPCPYSSCKSSFRYRDGLQDHVNVHTNTVFSCSFCQYRCVKNFNLRDHLNNHFDIMKHVCEICSVKFVRKQDLQTHEKIRHSDTEFECTHCKFTSASFSAVKKHGLSCKERLKHSRIL